MLSVSFSLSKKNHFSFVNNADGVEYFLRSSVVQNADIVKESFAVFLHQETSANAFNWTSSNYKKNSFLIRDPAVDSW